MSFQVVVLAPIFPDVDPAMSTAAGIKLLVDLLEQSTEDSIRALASDCIARLLHTRAGERLLSRYLNSVMYTLEIMQRPSRFQ